MHAATQDTGKREKEIKREMVTSNKSSNPKSDRQTLGHIFFFDFRNGLYNKEKILNSLKNIFRFQKIQLSLWKS